MWVYRVKSIEKNIEKNTDTINREKLFGRSADHKKFNIPRLVNFNHVFYVISSVPVFLD